MKMCVHCDEAAVPAVYDEVDQEQSRPFCCQGCMTVYNVLHAKGLESYYEIKNNSSVFKRRSPVEINQSHYKYLDDEEFLKEFSSESDQGQRRMEFYLEGIHCLACLWLIEKLPEFVRGVISSKLDLERSVVTVVVNQSGIFSQVARELNQLGYRPHPLKMNQDTFDLKLKEERLALIRIGVAGAAAGNIMLYAVSLYGGARDEFAQLFNALTVVFALPVLTFSAWPFYQNALNALKNKTLSIDIPITVSLLVGGVMGLYNLFLGIPDNYFDSLTTLVFLLLLSRYFLQKIQQKGLSATDLHFFYHSDSVLRARDSGANDFVEVHPRFVGVDDILKIRPGEFFPADGVILKGRSSLNCSLLTGESMPVSVQVGEKVFSGTQNLDQELLIKAIDVNQDSRLGRLLKNVENGWSHRSHIVNLTNQVSKYFTLVVFILSFILFFYLNQTHDFRYSLEGAITLLIVTCPCALALAVPLTFTRALSKAAEQGIIIKSDEVIEKLAKVKRIMIDKTGTITHGRLKVVDFIVHGVSQLPVESIIFHLESRSRHPVAQALKEFIREKQMETYEVEDYQEILGVGVKAKILNQDYVINREGIFENDRLVATFRVEDTIRADSRMSVKNLASQGLSISILSGDRVEVVKQIAAQVGLNPDNVLGNLSPEQKAQILRESPFSMMIGDGANDAIALSQADVGVAVMGSMDISLRAAEVYLTTPGLAPVEKLLTLSQETMKVIRRNLILSLTYNSLSVAAAFAGVINPLVAAIIMPLSSLTVLISTLVGTKKIRLLWKS
jgi:heavy metal-(Cd/Co/Hg/Pb/Zn)-translocating P-type ATPase